MKSNLPSLKMNLNLDEPLSIQKALATAARLGFDDEIRGVKAIPTGLEIITALGCPMWRQGHKRYLKSAYEAGRFSARMCVAPE
jgi:hypothetical protein